MGAPDDGEIHMKPMVLYGFMLAMGFGNVVYTTRATDPDIADVFTAAEGRALREQVAQLQGQIAMLSTTGPAGVLGRLEKVQGSLDGCMQCHLKNHTNAPELKRP
jgi:hypothetical protein